MEAISCGWYLLICTYLNMLYTRQVRAVAALARTMPMLLTKEPFMAPSMKPKIYSTRHLVLDLWRLFCFCSSVRGWLRCPFSQMTGIIPHSMTTSSLASQPASRYSGCPLSLFLNERIYDIGVVDTGSAQVIQHPASTGTYNLDGTPAAERTRGIVVEDGQKVMRK